MLPSERIEELFCQEKYWSNLPKAIITYLDEQYEKNKPCEHRSSTGTIHSNGQLLCDKCGQFFSNL